MTNSEQKCSEKSEKGMCLNKDAKGKPCYLDIGREDMCPKTLGFKVDKLAQEEDAGER